MRKLTRRGFLQYAGQAGIAAGATEFFSGCMAPCVPDAPSSMPIEDRATVAVIRGSNLADMAREALAAFGGAASFISPGETVFIKPNFGSLGMVKYNPIAVGESVKPEIVITVAEECLKAGASMVTIGEGSQVPSWDWGSVPTFEGSTNMAEEVQRLKEEYGGRVRLVCLNAETPRWIAVPSQSCLSTVDVSNLVLEADRVISLPVFKTHRWTLTTGAIKNLFGTTPIDRYNSPLVTNMRQVLHDSGLHQILVDIGKAVAIDFAIMDFSFGCEGNGPHVLPGWWGSTVDVRDRLGTWMMLASRDPVALDATSTRVIGLSAEDVTHIRLAYEQGLGQMLKERITLVGATLDEIQMTWQPPQLTEGFLEVVIPGIHLLADS